MTTTWERSEQVVGETKTGEIVKQWELDKGLYAAADVVKVSRR